MSPRSSSTRRPRWDDADYVPTSADAETLHALTAAFEAGVDIDPFTFDPAEHAPSPRPNPFGADSLHLDDRADARSRAEALPEGRFVEWGSLPRAQRGPEPVPAWLVTDLDARDRDLGVLKTGKEADVFLVERISPTRSCLLAEKRYRGAEHSLFTRSGDYTEGRRVRKSREMRAMRTGTAFGRELRAGQWAFYEWQTMRELYVAGLPLPYPVTFNGTGMLMEFIAGDEPTTAAPRLAQTRPEPRLLARLYDQFRDVLHALVARGITHGDLSPYNVLLAGDRLVVIDWPQVVDVVSNPDGMAFLRRDVTVMCDWFASRGLELDAEEVLADVQTYL